MAKVIKGIVKAKDVEGSPRYKVRYEGLGKEGDEWVGSDQVTEALIERFKAMKAKQVSKKEQQQQAAAVVDLSGEGAEAGASRMAAAGGGDSEWVCHNCKLAFRSDRCTGPGCDGVSRFILHTSDNGSEHHARSITAHTSGNHMSRRSFLKLLGAGGATGDAFRGDWARSLAQLAEYVGSEEAAGGYVFLECAGFTAGELDLPFELGADN
jgi:hypothetical protein